MRLALVALAVLCTGCIGNVDAHSRVSISRQGTGNVDEMRADLKACMQEGLGFEFIPDLGITAHRHRTKCMRQRGWATGSDVSGNGLPNFYRIATPAWATGE